MSVQDSPQKYDPSGLSLEELEEDFNILVSIDSELAKLVHAEIVKKSKGGLRIMLPEDDDVDESPDEDEEDDIIPGWGVVPLEKLYTIVPKNVNMVKSFKFFSPQPQMKSSAVHGTTLFFNTGKSLDRMASQLFRVSEVYSVEQKFCGLNVSIHKKKNKVMVYADKKEVTSKFKPLVDEVRLHNDDFILLGAMIPFMEGQPRKTTYLARRKKKADSSKFVCWDIINYNGKSLHDTILSERKKILSSLKFSYGGDVKESPYLLASDDNSLKQAIAVSLKAPLSNGVLIKDVSSIYPLRTDKTDKWIDYREAHIFDFSVEDVEEIKGERSCSLCTSGDSIERILKLGCSKTKLDIKKGDKVRVASQEVWKNSDGSFSLYKPVIVCKVDEQYESVSPKMLEAVSLGLED